MFSSIKMEEYMEPELSAWLSGDPFYAYEG